MQKVILYSNNCPKCKMLEMRLKQAKVDFSICTDLDTIINKKESDEMPFIEKDNSILNFKEAWEWATEVMNGNKM